MFKNIAVKIATVYFIVSTLWILVSDRAVMLLVSDPATMTIINSFKGMAFIVVTTVTLFVMVKIYVTRLEGTNKDLAQKKAELRSMNDNLLKIVQAETQKRVESQKIAIEQNRLAMMGEMLSAVAHHWRQPLNAVGLKVQDTYLAFQNSEITESYMRDFRDSTMALVYSMSKTIDDFRYFFVQSDKKDLFSIEDTLSKTIKLLSAKLENTSINIYVSYDEQNKKDYFGFVHEFRHVALNIISNAIDAVIASSNKEQSFIKVQTKYKNDKVIIMVEDSGGGIKPLVQDRIYEPYYTTKDQGDGNGIGLYMSKEIIERQMHGKLYDEQGEFGARFVIELPLV